MLYAVTLHKGAHNLNNMSYNLSEQLTRNVDKRYQSKGYSLRLQKCCAVV